MKKKHKEDKLGSGANGEEFGDWQKDHLEYANYLESRKNHTQICGGDINMSFEEWMAQKRLLNDPLMGEFLMALYSQSLK